MHPSLTVVIPAYNESHRLPQTLAEIRPFLAGRFETYEVIVVDDGSADATAALVRAAAGDWPQLRLLQQPKNIGKGAAIARGMLAGICDLILFMDADLATPIEEIDRLLQHFEESRDRVVVGVRTYHHEDTKWRRILGLSLQLLSHVLVFDRCVIDSQCGFKCFGRETARTIFRLTKIKGGMFDVEIFAIVQRLGIDVCYEPVRWQNKPGSRINFLRCIVFDPIDLLVIAFNGLRGAYRR